MKTKHADKYPAAPTPSQIDDYNARVWFGRKQAGSYHTGARAGQELAERRKSSTAPTPERW